MTKALKKRDPKDKWILICFLAFFGTVFAVDGFFVYTAITTQTGLVTEKPYEKGLAYNELLSQANNQPELNEKASYDTPNLSWKIADKAGNAIQNATVTARIIRPVQEGLDFDVVLRHVGGGRYSAPLSLPEKGAWVAKLDSKWESKEQQQTYKTTYPFVAE